MKVLHLGKYYPPFRGGMENFLAQLGCAQLEQGLGVRMLVHGAPRQATPPCRQGGEPQVVRAPTWGTFLYTPVSPAFRQRLKRELLERQPDLLHIHMPNPSAFWVLQLAEAHHIPWVVHWHSDVITARIHWKIRAAYHFYRPMEQALLKRARRILVTSPPYLETSPALSPWREKCRIVPLGLDPSRAEPHPELDPNWPAGGMKVLAVGRLSYYKGFNHLLRALRKTDELQLVVVGEGPQRKHLEKLRHQLGLQPRVRFAGNLDDRELAALMADCDCLCLPSIDRAEAFGMVLLEAMAASKPVVVSDVHGSGMGWVVEHERTGLKVEPANPIALREALLRLSRDNNLRHEMGAQGRKRFDRLFHISSIAERVHQQYQEALSQKS